MNNRITAWIHLDAAAHNFQVMKDNLKEGTQMIAVVKTDGYGHGAVPIAKMAQSYPYIWGFAVAAVSEAKELREAGIHKPILILGYTFEEDYEWMAQNDVRPSVFTEKMAREFASKKAPGKEALPVHLAVDTGMSRIGVPDNSRGLETAIKIARIPGIYLEGVFTHFARADEADKTSALDQLHRFERFCDGLNEAGIFGFLRHSSNSAAILEMPEANMDLVRAGISIYGIYPSGEMRRDSIRLKPVMELKSHVVYLKEIPAGTPVSYGGTFVADKKTVVATIPVGYGDGYPRSLSGKGSVLIGGKRCPILGRVCMDQFMVDVTDKDVNFLDEVTLLGRDRDEEITVEELSSLSGRFPYEFVCDIGKRVPRVFVPS